MADDNGFKDIKAWEEACRNNKKLVEWIDKNETFSCWHSYCILNSNNLKQAIQNGEFEQDSCEWKLDGISGFWCTGCDTHWWMSEDSTPIENGYEYCPCCGRKLREENK